MNEMLKLMHDRRSTYRPEPLRGGDPTDLEAGRFAPWDDKQLNHFYVITDPNYLADLTALVSARWNYRDKDFRYGAPVLVLRPTRRRAPASRRLCAMENMVLAAFSLGVGSAGSTALPRPPGGQEVRKLAEIGVTPEDAGGRTGPGPAVDLAGRPGTWCLGPLGGNKIFRSGELFGQDRRPM